MGKPNGCRHTWSDEDGCKNRCGGECDSSGYCKIHIEWYPEARIAALEATVSVLEYDVVVLEERCVLEKEEARLAEAEVERLKEFIRTAGEGSGGACKLDHWAEYQAHTELNTQTTPKEIKA